DTARFQCRLSKLSSNIQWFKDGIRILPSERIVYSVKGDLLTLTIHNAQIEDEENYRCMVDNQHRDATLTVEPLPAIFVRYLPKVWTVYGLRYSLYIRHGVQSGRYTIRIDDIHGQESSCQVSVEDLAEIERKKPRIIRGLEDLNLHEGELLELECQFECNDVEATWFFNNMILRSNIFTIINSKSNELARLIIKEVYLENAGLYKLRLKNKYGKVSTSCLVSVRQREPLTDQRKLSIEDLPLKFIEPISDVYVHEEQETHFRAIISGQSLSKVTCFCNYKKIAVGYFNIIVIYFKYILNRIMKKYRVTQDKDVYLVAISHANENDECEYTCKAENSAGEKTCSTNLHLIETSIGSKS
ncbi:unnamed protein product, partial [Rotaria sp. Silwood1]